MTLAAIAAPAAPAPSAPSALAVGGLGIRAPVPRAAFRILLAREDGGDGHDAAIVVASARTSGLPGPPMPASSTAAKHAGVDRTALASADDDSLDPLHRHRASLAPPDMTSFAVLTAASPVGPTMARPIAPEASARALSSLEELIPALVRRVAWSGDGRRGTARLEIGAGELSGATLLVHANEGHVRVHLDVPSGVDAAAWQRRISARLASRQISADSVEVT